MVEKMRKIIIKAIDKPSIDKPDYMISWFCEALGLSNTDDKNTIEAQLLKSFLIAAQKSDGISSSQIKLKGDIARTTVIYHMNRFIETGLVVKKGRKYYLRSNALSSAIEEIEYDIDRELQRMHDIAKIFDRKFNSYYNKKGKEVKID